MAFPPIHPPRPQQPPPNLPLTDAKWVKFSAARDKLQTYLAAYNALTPAQAQMLSQSAGVYMTVMADVKAAAAAVDSITRNKAFTNTDGLVDILKTKMDPLRADWDAYKATFVNGTPIVQYPPLYVAVITAVWDLISAWVDLWTWYVASL